MPAAGMHGLALMGNKSTQGRRNHSGSGTPACPPWTDQNPTTADAGSQQRRASKLGKSTHLWVYHQHSFLTFSHFSSACKKREGVKVQTTMWRKNKKDSQFRGELEQVCLRPLLYTFCVWCNSKSTRVLMKRRTLDRGSQAEPHVKTRQRLGYTRETRTLTVPPAPGVGAGMERILPQPSVRTNLQHLHLRPPASKQWDSACVLSQPASPDDGATAQKSYCRGHVTGELGPRPGSLHAATKMSAGWHSRLDMY